MRAALDRVASAAAEGRADRYARAIDGESATLRAWLGSLRVNGISETFSASYVSDAFNRFVHTLKFIPIPPPRRILEIGSNPYFFHSLVVHLFPDSQVVGSNFFDHNILSTSVGRTTQRVETLLPGGEDAVFESVLFNVETVPEWPFPPERFDLVLLCETLEHLAIDPLSVFAKARRVLAPGGHLLVTVPNAVRLSNVALMLEGANPFDIYHPENSVYGRHNREFTLDEMRRLVSDAGFRVVRAETRDRFDRSTYETLDYTGPSRLSRLDRSDVLKALRKGRGRLDDRGDNLYVLGERIGAEAAASASPHASAPPPHFIDVFDESGDAVQVVGWFVGVHSGRAWSPPVVSLRFDGPVTRTVETQRSARPDVARTLGLESADVGFEARVSTRDWPPGRYRLTLSTTAPGGAADSTPTEYTCRAG